MSRASIMGVAALVLAAIAPGPGARAEPAATASPRVSAAVAQAMTTTRQARVLVTLRDPAPRQAAAGDRQAAVSRVQDAVLAGVPAPDFTVTHRYRSTPGVAGTITPRGLERLRTDPNVVAVEIDEPGDTHLRVSVPALHADIVRAELGFTGYGVNVAVLDSGIDLDDPGLWVFAEQCFTHGACKPGNTTPAPAPRTTTVTVRTSRASSGRTDRRSRRASPRTAAWWP